MLAQKGYEYTGDPNIIMIPVEASIPEAQVLEAPVTIKEEIVPEAQAIQEAPVIARDPVSTVNESSIFISSTVKDFKKYFNVFDSIVNEVRITFRDNEIFISHVDPAHVCMISERIPARSLFDYKVINGDLDICIDLEKFLSRFKGADKNDIVTIHYSTVNDKTIFLTIGSFKYELNVLDGSIVVEAPKIPVLNLPGIFEAPVKTLYTFLVNAGKISDHMEIKINSDGLFLSAAGDVDKIDLQLTKYDLPLLVTDNTYISKYSIDYLLNVFKVLKDIYRENIRFNIGSDHPVKITGTGDAEITVLLAPRIEEA